MATRSSSPSIPAAVRVGDEEYALIQFHHHAPGEHTINGRPAALEIHLVHRSAAGSHAVVGVLFEPGAPNRAIAALLAVRAMHPLPVTAVILMP